MGRARKVRGAEGGPQNWEEHKIGVPTPLNGGTQNWGEPEIAGEP